jgi:sigma-B regulation protein RsbU (phosphoserine phosphatase)
MHATIVDRAGIERDLKVAKSVQGSFLPKRLTQPPGYEFAAHYESAQEVGGDYYDFIKLSENTLLFVVADVEGKGAASAMVMANVQATLHTLVRHVHSIEGVLYHLNERILEGTRGGKYMTMFLGLIDLPRRGLHYINAGHVAPVIVRPDGPVYLKEGGMVVGLLPGARYRRGHLVLRSGDVILTCTDGITEADTPSEDQYGSERMMQKAMTVREKSAQEIVDAIFEDVSAFSRGGHHQDDKVLMGIKVN